MRILADENFPGKAVEALRLHGHDVIWIKTDAPGSSDKDILLRATGISISQNRLAKIGLPPQINFARFLRILGLFSLWSRKCCTYVMV